MNDNKTTYAEKLKDPRWKRVRNDVVDKDGHRCMACHCHTNQLEVHHIKYRPNTEPWEYDRMELATLCHDCHLWVHENNIDLRVINHGERLALRQTPRNGIKQGSVIWAKWEWGESECLFIAAEDSYLTFEPLQNGDGDVVDRIVVEQIGAAVLYNYRTKEIAFNEYRLDLTGPFSDAWRPATEEEKQILLDAIKNYMK